MTEFKFDPEPAKDKVRDDEGVAVMRAEMKRASDIQTNYYESMREGYIILAQEFNEKVKRWAGRKADALAEALGDNYDVGIIERAPDVAIPYGNLGHGLIPSIASPTWDLRDGAIVAPGNINKYGQQRA